MDIIRNANILDQEDLLLLENHSLDKEYLIIRDKRSSVVFYSKNVTFLMLLINLVEKYPKINDLIKHYIKRIPKPLVLDEINYFCDIEFNALDICIAKAVAKEAIIYNNFDFKIQETLPNNITNWSYVETIKILLDNGIRADQLDWHTSFHYFNQSIAQSILEYDAINISGCDYNYESYCSNDKNKSIMNKINRNIALLNIKN